MISVCLATYNGERYIKEQLQSILKQLAQKDEIIVVDDVSTDHTVSIIQQLNDSRVKLFRNEHNLGPIKSFQKALEICIGDYIFLSDQDDVWLDEKVHKVLLCFEQHHAQLVVHDSIVTDAQLNTISNSWNLYNRNRFTSSWLLTVIKNPYTGANMAFTRSVIENTVPFPSKIPMHDSWLGAYCQKKGLRIDILSEALSLYRRHEDTVTGGSHKIIKMLMDRMLLFKALWRC
ncbi:glycosyltransferase [Lactiplantibacillus sp. WILCCON 0030]|uniref:Glycosyltransferase n=1 Tax=Lactiplantibacillus brownii TaxID=3069269 RepID=A0ABU1A9Y3_9LACO|nr:glycosyltransferase [Lactiplantibacillus brownii]MDQ7937737.1 glycosyltransferase [Lactiplantibacillus brownii]